MTEAFWSILLKEVVFVMKIGSFVGTSLAAMLLVSGLACASEMKSGLQPGDAVSPFDVLNCNGPSAGKRNCQI